MSLFTQFDDEEKEDKAQILMKIGEELGLQFEDTMPEQLLRKMGQGKDTKIEEIKEEDEEEKKDGEDEPDKDVKDIPKPLGDDLFNIPEMLKDDKVVKQNDTWDLHKVLINLIDFTQVSDEEFITNMLNAFNK
jgi:hypothetical protein